MSAHQKSIEAILRKNFTELMLASHRGNEQHVGEIINHDGFSSTLLNATTKASGKSAFLFACEQGHENVVRQLMTHPLFSSETLNLVSLQGETALYLAAKGGHLDICNLIQNHAQFDDALQNRETADGLKAEHLIAIDTPTPRESLNFSQYNLAGTLFSSTCQTKVIEDGDKLELSVDLRF